MRFSADAVRSIDERTTRYPVEYGPPPGASSLSTPEWATTNSASTPPTSFLRSAESMAPLRQVRSPRHFFRPACSNRAWFFDGLETEYDNIYISELPSNADTNELHPRKQSGSKSRSTSRPLISSPSGCSSTTTTRPTTASLRLSLSRALPTATPSPGCLMCATSSAFIMAHCSTWASASPANPRQLRAQWHSSICNHAGAAAGQLL